ncbi:sushi, von Willebrand factor type A, EGF and pentraxin domain-containing protein 1-like isoform X1 [Sycon ciliatum]|uniref:sushi, von Willebrand factor type A, EGF and pentraxin domain-containing protein 1-like isoform X1 n=1 Tax=Sycon ciliatum TaxID=27933 RepID=UPI0031F6247F
MGRTAASRSQWSPSLLLMVLLGLIVTAASQEGNQVVPDPGNGELGTVFGIVEVQPDGTLACYDPIPEDGGSVEECRGYPLAQGWMALDGVCHRCPGDSERAQIVSCEQDGMEYQVNTEMHYSCGFGYSLSAGSSETRLCAEVGWLPPKLPVCVKQDDPSVLCPSDWRSWGQCEAMGCGEPGMRIRERGKYFVFPGSGNDYYSQCNPQSGYEECVATCDETTQVPQVTTDMVQPNATTLPPVVSTQQAVTEAATEPDTEAPTTQQADTEVPTTQEADTEAPTTPEPAAEVPVTKRVVTEARTEAQTEAATEAPAVETEQPTVAETTMPAVETTVKLTKKPVFTTRMAAEPTEAPQGPEETVGRNPGMPMQTAKGYVPPAMPTVPAVNPVNEVVCEYENVQYPVNTVLSHSCANGYQRTNGKAYRKCKGDGLWHGKEPVCIHRQSHRKCPPDHTSWGDCSKVCRDVPGPAGIKERFVHDLEITYDAASAQVTSKCVIFRETQACRGDYKCNAPCERLAVENGVVRVVQHPFIKSYHNGSQVEVICNEFYELTSALPTVLCHNGEWANPIPRCILNPKHSCTPVPNPANGICGPAKQEYAIDEYVVCTCDPGYGNQGSAIRYCLENHQWSGKPGQCVRDHPKTCGDPGYPENGQLAHGRDFGRVGSQVSYYCRTGFSLRGRRVLTCQRDGRWDHPRPNCEFNFQPVSSLVHSLMSIPARSCTGNACPCMAQESCQSCYRPSAFTYRNVLRQHQHCCGTCNKYCLELVFAIDESGSIKDKHFSAAIEFTEDIVSSYLARTSKLAPDCLRVGAVKFSHHARVVANLTDAREFRWPEEEMTPSGGGTGIRCGLTKVNEVLRQSRRGCRKVVFVITDGKSNHCGNPAKTAAALRCACSELFVVGIGSDLEMRKLTRIASNPTENHLFVLRHFDDLFQFGAAFRSGVVTV